MSNRSPALSLLLLCCFTSMGCPAAEDNNTATKDMNAVSDMTGDQSRSDMSDLDMNTTADQTKDMVVADQTTDITADLMNKDMDDMTDQGATDMSSGARVSIMVGSGYMGRTILSCDGGKHWIADQAFLTASNKYTCDAAQPTARCYDEAYPCSFARNDGDACQQQTSCDCDHSPGRPTGIAHGDGAIVATFGWGATGPIMRSEDGVTWQEVATHRGNIGGLAYGDGAFIAFSRQPQISRDGGKTWQDTAPLDLTSPNGTIFNVRSAAYLPQTQGGAFIAVGQDGDKHAIQLSHDAGTTWFSPTMPTDCSDGVRGFASSPSTIVILRQRGDVCVSEDRGLTFTRHAFSSEPTTPPIYAKGTFYAWNNNTTFTSTDGKTWYSSTIAPSDVRIGAVSYDPVQQQFVAARGGWKQWYEKQRFYTSTDGYTWQELPESDAPRGHMIRFITTADAPASTCANK